MTRVKRWINMNKKEFNADGTLKEEAKIQLLAEGLSNAAIDDYAAGFKSQYEEWKKLDETEPEPWVEYTAYDLFSQEERKKFNPDGTLRPEYIEYARNIGLSEGYLEQLEYKKKLDVENFNRMSKTWAARGMNFGEYQMRSRHSAINNSYAERQEQMHLDLRNFEDIDSLPFEIDLDDYYKQH